jgi:hypothetical protein
MACIAFAGWHYGVQLRPSDSTCPDHTAEFEQRPVRLLPSGAFHGRTPLPHWMYRLRQRILRQTLTHPDAPR